jgi:hypothetical protein
LTPPRGRQKASAAKWFATSRRARPFTKEHPDRGRGRLLKRYVVVLHGARSGHTEEESPSGGR